MCCYVILLAACGGGANSTKTPALPDFGITASSITGVAGQSAPMTITVTGLNGFAGNVDVALSSLPGGVTATPGTSLTIPANSTRTLTLSFAANLNPSTFAVDVTASSGSLAHTTRVAGAVVPAIQTSQNGTVISLTSRANGQTAQISVETRWGGSIVEASFNGRNFVNRYDAGREIQPALYDGSAQYDDCAGCSGHFGWDPVMGGDLYAHGSPVLSSVISEDSIFTRTQPLQWYPDTKGGGKNLAVASDMLFEQTISVAPQNPLAFQVHYKLIHTGSDTHYQSVQEVPAIYVNGDLRTFVRYNGASPWTGDAPTRTNFTTNKLDFTEYTPERWAAYVDSTNTGLSVYSPDAMPWFAAFFNMSLGGPAGSDTHYMRPYTAFTIAPNAVLEGDLYVLPGNLADNTAAINAIHNVRTPQDILPPMGSVDYPSAGATLRGMVDVSGWALDDTVVSRVEVFVDGVSAGLATYGSARPDVARDFENAEPNIGWHLPLDTSTLSNGSHTILVQYQDAAGNTAILAPVAVTVAN